ncbi:MULTISPECIES: barstar family protein [unclassified Curtobacterium]|uniref:barstar family protein n=1 Tax=unclassified Curtobacterium TaxID=257496 RepID=UPI000FAA888F|nr:MULTISPECIES: barstar family protein [unclassified Curtobacterium]ROQ16722.1 barstar (barnase inhibitor) [Curtobacterium sp. PhB171]ROQ25202.1 barstar (barnase inhibitor) [Curtobacterium sp. PhB170]ROS36653.1 barstar (barnase inhibitor) [Curtobacterium sp. PhB131]ROS71330.1 barstar (barnase inhibitor) [Curtobacterium sp. PhB141]
MPMGREKLKALKVELGGPIESEGEVSLRLDGKRCRTRADFLREIGVALQFPPYYGANWDALEECVHDLTWLPDAHVNLVVENADQLLVSDPERELDIFVDVLRAGTEWQRALTMHLGGNSSGRISTAFAALLEGQCSSWRAE